MINGQYDHVTLLYEHTHIGRNHRKEQTHSGCENKDYRLLLTDNDNNR